MKSKSLKRYMLWPVTLRMWSLCEIMKYGLTKESTLLFSPNLFHLHKHILFLKDFASSWLHWRTHHQSIDTKPAPWINLKWPTYPLVVGEWWTPAKACQSSDVCLSTWSETATPYLASSIKTGLQYPIILLVAGTNHLCILLCPSLSCHWLQTRLYLLARMSLSDLFVPFCGTNQSFPELQSHKESLKLLLCAHMFFMSIFCFVLFCQSG